MDKGKKAVRPKRAAHDLPSGKKPKKTFKEVQLKCLVDIVERSHGSKNSVNNAPSPVVDPVRKEISALYFVNKCISHLLMSTYVQNFAVGGEQNRRKICKKCL